MSLSNGKGRVELSKQSAQSYCTFNHFTGKAFSLGKEGRVL